FVQARDQLPGKIPVGTLERIFRQAGFEHLRGFAAFLVEGERREAFRGKGTPAVRARGTDFARFFQGELLGANRGLANHVIDDARKLPSLVPGGEQVAGDLAVDAEALPIPSAGANLLITRLVFE